jgi:tetratricopeptide (TPR) repeat protein
VSFSRSSHPQQRPLYETFTDDGATALEAGDLTKAESCFTAALVELEKLGSQDHQGLLTIGLMNLATVYRHQERYVEAIQRIKRALGIIAERKQIDHPLYLHGLKELTGLYQALDDTVSTEACLQEILKTQQMLLGETHPALIPSLRKLEAFYLVHNRHDEATEMGALVKTIEETPANWKIYNTEGGEAYYQKDYPTALAYFERANALIVHLPLDDPDRHKDQARLLHNIASVHKRMGDLEAAEAVALQALSRYQTFLPKHHAGLSGPLRNLMDIYEAMGRKKDGNHYRRWLRSLRDDTAE